MTCLMGVWRSALTCLAALACLAQPALGQISINEAELERILQEDVAPVIGDVDLLLLEGPKYLAKRLPAMQAAGDFGGQMDLLTPGDFSLGIGVLGGVFFGFDDEVGNRFQKFPNKLPEPLPIPAGVISGRVAVTPDFELAGRYGFFPNFEVKSKGYLIKGTTSIWGLKGRYRHSRAKGWTPAFIGSAGYSYFTGFLNVGRDFSFNLTPIRNNEFNQTVNEAFGRNVLGDGEEVNWRAFFSGAPIIGWDIHQISLEERMVWDVGFWHPYLGAGVDYAWGHVDSGTDLELDARLSGPGPLVEAWQNANNGSPKLLDIIPRQRRTLVTESPRTLGGRAIVGTEFDIGSVVRFALGAQYDVGTGSIAGGFTLRFASITPPPPPPPPPEVKPRTKRPKKGARRGQRPGKSAKKAPKSRKAGKPAQKLRPGQKAKKKTRKRTPAKGKRPKKSSKKKPPNPKSSKKKRRQRQKKAEP
ncbi:MAG: hypothetical protein ACE366_31945 [Bradymonadia bacterium]